ncbi:MAG: hypothetical protein WA624_21030 [Methylocella sp.]
MHDQPMVGRSRLKGTLISFGVFIFVSWVFEHIAHRETFEAALNPHTPDEAIICSVDAAIQLT